MDFKIAVLAGDGIGPEISVHKKLYLCKLNMKNY